MRHLLQPSARLLKIMDPMLQRMRGALTVGLQLRSEYLNFGQDQLFFRCFEEIADTYGHAFDGRALVFLTTDSQEIVENFQSLLGPDRFLYLNKTIVHIGGSRHECYA